MLKKPFLKNPLNFIKILLQYMKESALSNFEAVVMSFINEAQFYFFLELFAVTITFQYDDLINFKDYFFYNLHNNYYKRYQWAIFWSQVPLWVKLLCKLRGLVCFFWGGLEVPFILKNYLIRCPSFLSQYIVELCY